jgi:hypothetical protein
VTMVNLVLLFAFVSQLAFLCGLRAKTQGRAVTTALGAFVAWCLIPLFLLVFTEAPAAILYLSPIGGLLVNEFPGLGVDRVTGLRLGVSAADDGFLPYVGWFFSVVTVFILRRVNHRVAALALFRDAPPISRNQVGRARSGQRT